MIRLGMQSLKVQALLSPTMLAMSLHHHPHLALQRPSGLEAAPCLWWERQVAMVVEKMGVSAPTREELLRRGSPLLHALVCRTTGMRAIRADTFFSCNRTWVGLALGGLVDKTRNTWGARAAWRPQMQQTPTTNERYEPKWLHETECRK